MSHSTSPIYCNYVFYSSRPVVLGTLWATDGQIPAIECIILYEFVMQRHQISSCTNCYGPSEWILHLEHFLSCNIFFHFSFILFILYYLSYHTAQGYTVSRAVLKRLSIETFFSHVKSAEMKKIYLSDCVYM